MREVGEIEKKSKTTRKSREVKCCVGWESYKKEDGENMDRLEVGRFESDRKKGVHGNVEGWVRWVRYKKRLHENMGRFEVGREKTNTTRKN